MKRVDIISKVVGRDSSGKPVGGGVSIPMGNYALKSDFELLKSMFNDFLEGDDTDSVINRWKDLEAFLNGISEEDPLTSILGNYIPIKGYTDITGEKNFIGGLKINGSPIYYDTEKKYWKLEGDLLVTGGVTMFGNDSDFVASTIMDAILYDDSTLGINANGQLYVKGGTGGGVSGDYLPLTGGQLSGTLVVGREDSGNYTEIRHERDWTKTGITSLLGTSILVNDYNGISTRLNINSDLGLFYTSSRDNHTAKYPLLHSGNYSSYALPLSGGTLTGNLTFGVANNTSYYDIDLSRNGNFIKISNTSYKLLLEYKYKSYETYHGLMVDEYGAHYTQRTDLAQAPTKYTLWHSGNDGSGSGLDADLLDGYDSSYIMKYGGNWTASTDTAGIFAFGFGGSSAGLANNYGAGIQLCNAQGVNAKPSLNNNNSNWYSQLLFGTNDRVYARFNTNGGGWSTQHQIAYVTDNVASATRVQAYTHDGGEKVIISGSRSDNTFPRKIYDNGIGLVIRQTESNGTVHKGYIASINSNVASATKLQTARTIWGQSFDGTGNVSGSLYLGNNNPINANNSSGTSYNILNLNQGNALTLGYGTAQAGYGTYIDGYNVYLRYGTSRTTGLFLNSSGNVGIGTTSPRENLEINNYALIGGNILVGKGAIGFNRNTYQGGRYDTKYQGWQIDIGNNTLNFFTEGSLGTGNRVIFNASGNILATGGVTMYSDQRKKTILNHVELSLQQVANAPLIEHYYNSDKNKTTHVGSIAQYWAEMNDWFCKKDSEGYYTMEIQNAALASAISVARELVKFETETDRRIRLLEEENKKLKEEVEQLKWNIA